MNVKHFVVKCTYVARRVRHMMSALQAKYAFKYSSIAARVSGIVLALYSKSKMEK